MQKRTISEPEKKVVAARQGWRCSACRELLPAAFQVDHTVALCDGGADHLSNTTAMCGTCHAAKTQLETIARHKRAETAKPVYADREDIFVGNDLVKCSLCRRVRNVALGHDVCLAIESPLLQSTVLQSRLAEFAFVPR